MEEKKSDSEKIKELKQKIKELEQKTNQKQIEIDFLEKMMEIASEELDIDIKKGKDPTRSGGADKSKNRKE